ncbi:hypothetical protein NSS79_29235 [Paenibacillus sp. FSL L8-0436]|uniref:hypothetical protein n=1 Tax=Paenibacillus sp. FSL L8-0436 TaxID=2954686 RepID=UPI003158A8FA
MLKSTLVSVLLTAFILLTACTGGLNKSNTAVNTPGNDVKPTVSQSPLNGNSGVKEQDITGTNLEDVYNFDSGMFINLKSYEDQLTEENVSALSALEKNLAALVEHNNTDYNAGFVNEKLVDAMKYYYGEQFQYRFTAIESIEPNPMNGNLHITVTGQRLDTDTQTIEDVKMMYALGQNDQGNWVIYTID